MSDGNTHYTTDAKVGSLKKKNILKIDTGSSDLLVIGEDAGCRIEMHCKKFGSYSPEKSKTCKRLSNPFCFNSDYIEGYQRGTFVTDTVRFGKLDFKNQQFGVATEFAPGIVGSLSENRSLQV